VVQLDGVQVPLRTLPLDPRTRRRLMRGSYEPSERDLVKQFVQSGDQILELGASVGIVSCFLSKQAGKSGRLVCVEADVRLKEPFQRQLGLNGIDADWINALCCPIWRNAVPETIARQTFQCSDKTLSGRATTAASASGGPPWLTAAKICEQTGLAPTVLVVDIEGSEAVWVEHAPRIPATVRAIIAEFHPRLTGSRIAGQATQAILDEGFCVAGMHQTVLAFTRNR
jgi:FkbM family methyltransferase